jgi:hypothetical protein
MDVRCCGKTVVRIKNAQLSSATASLLLHHTASHRVHGYIPVADYSWGYDSALHPWRSNEEAGWGSEYDRLRLLPTSWRQLCIGVAVLRAGLHSNRPSSTPRPGGLRFYGVQFSLVPSPLCYFCPTPIGSSVTNVWEVKYDIIRLDTEPTLIRTVCNWMYENGFSGSCNTCRSCKHVKYFVLKASGDGAT